jgi:hypothetical protein
VPKNQQFSAASSTTADRIMDGYSNGYAGGPTITAQKGPPISEDSPADRRYAHLKDRSSDSEHDRRLHNIAEMAKGENYLMGFSMKMRIENPLGRLGYTGMELIRLVAEEYGWQYSEDSCSSGHYGRLAVDGNEYILEKKDLCVNFFGAHGRRLTLSEKKSLESIMTKIRERDSMIFPYLRKVL